MRPGVTRASAAVVAALLTAACQASPKAERSTITLAVRADVTGFFPNPPIANEGYTLDVNWNIFEGLVRFDPQFRLEPSLAARWENPDERTYLFDLRPGLRFSDGREVTAEDVAVSLEAPRRREWVTRDYLQAVESARARSPSRVEVRTRFPYLILLSKLPWGMVLPKDAVDKTPVPAVGTGPYRLESWSPGKEFVLVANPHYRGPRPAFDRARFVVVPDGADRTSRVERGEADIADQVPLELIGRLEQDKRIVVHARPANRVLYLGLRSDRAPFSDARVREAVDIALDRRELSRRALASRAEPASQLVPPTIVGFNPKIPLTLPNRERARQLLAEAGLARLELRLDGPRNRYVNDVQILEEVARQLGEIGVKVEVNAQDKAPFFDLVTQGRSNFYLLGWACQTGEAGDALDALLHTPTGFLGSDNTYGFSDADLDTLIDRANASHSPAERTATLQQALARVAAKRPILPLVIQTESVAVSKRIAWDPPLNFALRLRDMRPAR